MEETGDSKGEWKSWASQKPGFEGCLDINWKFGGEGGTTKIS